MEMKILTINFMMFQLQKVLKDLNELEEDP